MRRELEADGTILPDNGLARHRRGQQPVVIAAVISDATEPERCDRYGTGRNRDGISQLKFTSHFAGHLIQHIEDHRIQNVTPYGGKGRWRRARSWLLDHSGHRPTMVIGQPAEPEDTVLRGVLGFDLHRGNHMTAGVMGSHFGKTVGPDHDVIRQNNGK